MYSKKTICMGVLLVITFTTTGLYAMQRKAKKSKGNHHVSPGLRSIIESNKKTESALRDLAKSLKKTDEVDKKNLESHLIISFADYITACAVQFTTGERNLITDPLLESLLKKYIFTVYNKEESLNFTENSTQQTSYALLKKIITDDTAQLETHIREVFFKDLFQLEDDTKIQTSIYTKLILAQEHRSEIAMWIKIGLVEKKITMNELNIWDTEEIPEVLHDLYQGVFNTLAIQKNVFKQTLTESFKCMQGIIDRREKEATEYQIRMNESTITDFFIKKLILNDHARKNDNKIILSIDEITFTV